jgi:hypothetical protein
MYTDTCYTARRAAAQALIEAELRQTAQVAEDDPRLPVDVEVFAVSFAEWWSSVSGSASCVTMTGELSLIVVS